MYRNSQMDFNQNYVYLNCYCHNFKIAHDFEFCCAHINTKEYICGLILKKNAISVPPPPYLWCNSFDNLRTPFTFNNNNITIKLHFSMEKHIMIVHYVFEFLRRGAEPAAGKLRCRRRRPCAILFVFLEFNGKCTLKRMLSLSSAQSCDIIHFIRFLYSNIICERQRNPWRAAYTPYIALPTLPPSLTRRINRAALYKCCWNVVIHFLVN